MSDIKDNFSCLKRLKLAKKRRKFCFLFYQQKMKAEIWVTAKCKLTVARNSSHVTLQVFTKQAGSKMIFPFFFCYFSVWPSFSNWAIIYG